MLPYLTWSVWTEAHENVLRSIDSSPYILYSVTIFPRQSSPLTPGLVLSYFNMVSRLCLPVEPCLIQKRCAHNLRKHFWPYDRFHQDASARKLRVQTDHKVRNDCEGLSLSSKMPAEDACYCWCTNTMRIFDTCSAKKCTWPTRWAGNIGQWSCQDISKRE